jgi:hypothetical protein
MFNTKSKAALLLLCGIAALCLGMGGLLYQTHARQEAELVARQEAEQARDAANVHLAEQESSAKQEAQKALDRLAGLQARARETFNAERQELREQMNKLEAEERETLAKLEAEAGELHRRALLDTDKLDQILKRLDHIEQRLERAGSSSVRKK